jgi:hypothetical protein
MANKRTHAVVRGPKSRPIPAVRGLTERQAKGAVRDRRQRPYGSNTNWRTQSDSSLDRLPRGRGGLAGTGDAGTARAKSEERNKRQADARRRRSR